MNTSQLRPTDTPSSTLSPMQMRTGGQKSEGNVVNDE